MKLHLYSMCLNEEKMIPYFLRHYLNLVDKFFIFDNGSRDKSVELLKGDERIIVQEVKTEGDSFCHFYRGLMNNAWKTSRGEADWILTAEMDEHLHHPDLRSYLSHCQKVGTTILTATGFEMIADRFPSDPRPLWMHVTHGAREKLCDKPAIFDPNAIVETNYDHGRHLAAPQGNVKFEEFPQIKLLHYKSLGLEYVCDRNRTLAVGLKADDISEKTGSHYLRSDAQTAANLRDIRASARRVPGLPSQHNDLLELVLEDEVAAVYESQLFDPGYYVQKNPDVGESKIDPCLHFCTYGWREDRWPNPMFDPKWYHETYLGRTTTDINPLLHYILVGEKRGHFPVPFFDPDLYRLQNRLPLRSSALQHVLARKRVNQDFLR